MTRSGFVGLAGRPNVGKSTLVNAIVGVKVAIISDRPQTTRRAVRGIATDLDAGWQMILIDLPGVQRPRDSLTERMQHRVERELADADTVLFVVNGEQGIGPGDRFIAETLLERGGGTRVVAAVNKCDRLDKAKTAEVLNERGRPGDRRRDLPAQRAHGIGPRPACRGARLRDARRTSPVPARRPIRTPLPRSTWPSSSASRS